MKNIQAEHTKLNITADVDSYPDKELEFRAVATLRLLKLDTVKLILSVLKEKKFKFDESKAIIEILGFAIFHCWHSILSVFKNQKKADLFNVALSELFKWEYKVSNQMFTKYYEPIPPKGNFNEITWPVWLFGKNIAQTKKKKDPNIVLAVVKIMPHIWSSIYRTLNITLNLENHKLLEFMALVDGDIKTNDTINATLK